MSQREVVIEKGLKRYTVKTTGKDEEILAIVRGINKRVWDRENLQWSLPIESLDDFIKAIHEKQYVYDVIERKPWALCILEGDNYVIKMSEYVEGIDFRPFNGRWDSERYRFIVPTEAKIQLQVLLEKCGVTCIFSCAGVEHNSKFKAPKRRVSPY